MASLQCFYVSVFQILCVVPFRFEVWRHIWWGVHLDFLVSIWVFYFDWIKSSLVDLYSLTVRQIYGVLILTDVVWQNRLPDEIFFQHFEFNLFAFALLRFVWFFQTIFLSKGSELLLELWNLASLTNDCFLQLLDIGFEDFQLADHHVRGVSEVVNHHVKEHLVVFLLVSQVKNLLLCFQNSDARCLLLVLLERGREV